jgi:Tol biopolymer transport system component
VNARGASALVAATLLSVACAQPGPAPAFAGRNGDVLYAKRLSGRTSDLYASRPGGGADRRLTRTPDANELDPAASPDGRLIAYTRVLVAHRGSRIWIARRDGSRQRFVTRGSEPAWSPDGRRIAFVGPRRPPEKPEIYVMRADGTHLRRLTRNSGASDRSPAWSPDGRRIAFLSNRNAEGGPGQTGIWVMDTKGRHAVDLTPHAGVSDHPAWSPDGRRILFERSVDLGPYRLFAMNADGSDPHQVGTLAGWMPTWSPDGRQIAFISFGTPFGYGRDILRANADGSGVRRVARVGAGSGLAVRGGGPNWRVRIAWRVRAAR